MIRSLRVVAALGAALFVPLVARPAAAQQLVRNPDQVITLERGASILLRNDAQIQRFSVGDPTIAEAVAISPREILINAKAMGTTTLLTWTTADQVRLYTLEITPDAVGLERYLKALMPDEQIKVAASGKAVTLSGAVRDASMAQRAVDLAKGTGATVVDNLSTPAPLQVELHVRFAEMSKTAIREYNALLQTTNPHKLSDDGTWTGSSDSRPSAGSGGLVEIALSTVNGARIDALFQNLQSRGEFRSLAEPTLLALPGKEASFLAGGEFPFPIPQGGISNTITIVFKEFGVRLRFVSTITREGAIRLKLMPEVSQLDFSNALVISGFRIPSLITRRAETEIEMRENQHLAIAGLVDNRMLKNASKIPILGDIPILGQLFRSRSAQENKTQLVVIVTPRLVQASDTMPGVPTGEPGTWKQDKQLAKPLPGEPAGAAAAPTILQ